MKHKRIRLLLIVLLILAAVFSGCGKEKDSGQEGSFQMQYLNRTEDQIVTRPCDLNSSDLDGQITELISRLSETPDEDVLTPVIPREVLVQGYTVDENILMLDFNKAYKNLDSGREILTRAGIVRAFTQLEVIKRVEFLIDGEPLLDSYGKEVGLMTAGSFVENSGKNINAYLSAEMTLYFTDSDGDELIPERRRVYYISNETLEKAVVGELIKGPLTDGLYAVLPAETNVLSVTVQENVCYVNFDSSFNNTTLNVKEEVTLYSIVDSLAQTCGVDKVQFTIDGESSVMYRGAVRLDQLFQKNTDLIQEESRG